MKNKGFTLVELLAVIVVLAIIAVITVPMILGIVERARKGALKDSAYGLIEAGNLFYTQKLTQGSNVDELKFTMTNGKFILNGTEEELKFKGAKPTTGDLTITSSKASIRITDGTYCAYKSMDDIDVSVVKGNCSNVDENGELDEQSNSKASAVVGTMQIFAGSTVPDGYLLCDGQAVSRETYAALFAEIGTTWGEGDGSTTFNVPDMREVAPIGVGESTRTEGTHDTYTLGEFKDDQLQSHTHSIRYWATTGGSNINGAAGGGLSSKSGTGNNDGRSGTVTRGKRIGVNYIIKY